jgi:hypothetical protein
VGAVLLENDGAAFVYVTADGSKQYTEGTVISASGGVQAGISDFAGSFVVSLHNGTTHSTQATVSSCPSRSRAAPSLRGLKGAALSGFPHLPHIAREIW